MPRKTAKREQQMRSYNLRTWSAPRDVARGKQTRGMPAACSARGRKNWLCPNNKKNARDPQTGSRQASRAMRWCSRSTDYSRDTANTVLQPDGADFGEWVCRSLRYSDEALLAQGYSC